MARSAQEFPGGRTESSCPGEPLRPEQARTVDHTENSKIISNKVRAISVGGTNLIVSHLRPQLLLKGLCFFLSLFV